MTKNYAIFTILCKVTAQFLSSLVFISFFFNNGKSNGILKVCWREENVNFKQSLQCSYRDFVKQSKSMKSIGT